MMAERTKLTREYKKYLLLLYRGDKKHERHTVDQMVKITGKAKTTLIRHMDYFGITRRKIYFK